MEQLKYCQRKYGEHYTCSNLAVYIVKLVWRNRKCTDKIKDTVQYRCEKCKNHGTVGKKVVEQKPFDQSKELETVNIYLRSLVGRRINSSRHGASRLEVKYLKPNGGVMCFDDYSKKWQFVYYHQIEI